MSKWINDVAEIHESKDGKRRYIKVLKTFSAKKGNTLNVIPHKEYLENKLSKELITQEEVDRALSAAWVHFKIDVPPQTHKKDCTGKLTDKGWLNNILTIKKPKDGSNTYYIYVNKDFTVHPGQYINLKKFRPMIPIN